MTYLPRDTVRHHVDEAFSELQYANTQLAEYMYGEGKPINLDRAVEALHDALEHLALAKND